MPLEYIYNKLKKTLRTLDMKLEKAKYNYIDKKGGFMMDYNKAISLGKPYANVTILGKKK